MPDYGESPDLLELRAKLAAANRSRRGPVEKLKAHVRKRRDAAEVHQAFRTLFMPDGALSPAATVALDYVAERAGFGAASLDLDHAQLCKLEGKRELLLEMLARLRVPITLVDELEKSR